MPGPLSSTTMQSDGRTPSAPAACRNKPGSGFQTPTSYELKILPEKNGARSIVSGPGSVVT